MLLCTGTMYPTRAQESDYGNPSDRRTLAGMDTLPRNGLLPSQLLVLIKVKSNLNCLLRNDKQVLTHHFEPAGKAGEPGAQVHVHLKLHKDILVVVVGVREQPVQTAHDREQVLGRRGGDSDSGVEIVAVLNDACGVVQRVDHVVNRRTFLRLLVRRTHVQPRFVRSHFGARLRGAAA